jgi:hypothetical protein
LTSIQASPKALTPEDATQKLMRMRASNTTRLSAPEAARVLHNEMRRDGRLKPGVTVEQISVAVQRVRESKARIALQTPPVSPDEEADTMRPTGARMAKGDIGQHMVRGEGRRYKTKTPVEHYSGQWPSHVEAAFTCFVFDSEVGEYGRVTINYGGTGGGVPGSRLGGLGNALDRQRDAHERYCWVRERLSPDALQTLDSLVLQIREDAHSMNLESFGQHLFPAIRDKATRRGISIGALRVAGDQLAMLYRKFAVLSYAPKTELRDITPVRQARREPGVD